MEKFNDNYDRVLALVKNGVNIEKACKTIGLNRWEFYIKMNNIQKREIKQAKSMQGIYSRVSRRQDYVDIHHFFTDQDKAFE